jgi:hypothetical protein
MQLCMEKVKLFLCMLIGRKLSMHYMNYIETGIIV